jgi:glucokinase
MEVIGLDLGATKLSGAIYGQNGTILNKTVVSLEKRSGDEVADLITGLIRDEIGFAASEGKSISAIGCCVPGIAYPGTGRIWAPNIAGWEDYPLLERIKREIQDERIIVLIDNDRACSILGETWLGTARNFKNAVFLAVGTGIGAGIMVDGRVLRGSSDIAGAIGWLAMDQSFREEYSAYGCFEYNASGDGLVRVAREYIGKDNNYSGMLRKSGSEDLTTLSIFDAYQQKDPVALLVLDRAIRYWGMAVANLVSLFNPEIIVFGGGVFGPAVMFLEDILTEARRWAQPVSIRQVRIRSSSLGGDAGLAGAAFLALSGRPGMNDQYLHRVQ